MQLTSVVAVIFAISSVALAQSAPPVCALTCLQKTGTFGCQMTDNACLCKNQQFISAQRDCYNTTCTGDALKQATDFAGQTCSAVGVTLSNLPPSSTGGAPASSAAPAATSPAPAASASSTSKPKSAASSLTVPVGLLAIVAASSLAL